MTEINHLSDKELSEALNFHRRQRNLSRGVNESHHMRQTQMVRLLEAEEARRLEEAADAKPTHHYFVTKNDVGPGKKKLTHSKSKPFTSERDALDHIKKSGGRQDGIIHKVNIASGKIVQNRGVASGQYGYPSDVTGDDPHHIRDLKEEVEQIDEISASTLQSYVGKARDSKKAEMKNRTAAKNYGDTKARDDAARKVVNRNTGISVANKKLGTYPTDKAKAKVMAKEEVSLDEASYRDSGYANMLKASRKADKEADKIRAKREKEAKKAGEPKAEFKEEADLRITTFYNKWPKKATYAVHTLDRQY